MSAPETVELTASLTALGVTRTEDYTDNQNPNDTLADYLIISDVTLSKKSDAVTAVNLKDNPAYTKCARSWKYFKAEDGANITPRDAVAVKEWDAS